MKFFRYVLSAIVMLTAPQVYADVNDSITDRRFSIPLGAQGLVMPRADWALNKEQRRSDGKVAYYMMYSEQARTVFSVYIDKTGPCRSADDCLKEALKNPLYKDAQEIKMTDDRQFKVAYFYLDKPQGLAVSQAHVLASAYVDGLWFDIHISQTNKERPDIGGLLELMKTLQLK
ncbi:hypothetical protein [Duganella sp. BJB476]|uniref:hypothetical protein n=1 Tax=Duganella sp. BJB476 TaxID=1871176 RepID=UPI0011C1A0A4|nr:hypothetical protein [Duganella sp. BJB476]